MWAIKLFKVFLSKLHDVGAIIYLKIVRSTEVLSSLNTIILLSIFFL